MLDAGKMPTFSIVPDDYEPSPMPDDWYQGTDMFCETCTDDEGYPIELLYVVGSDQFWYNGDHTAHSIDFMCTSCQGVWDVRCD